MENMYSGQVVPGVTKHVFALSRVYIWRVRFYVPVNIAFFWLDGYGRVRFLSNRTFRNVPDTFFPYRKVFFAILWLF